MLDDLELPQAQEVTTLERRVLAEHKPPGMEGSLLQNLGRRPTRLTLWGVAAGPDAKSFVEKLDAKFKNGAPVPFTADIVADAEIEEVVIQDLRIQDLAGKPERFAYVLTLREYIEPVEPEEASIDAEILDDARGLIDDLVLGLNVGFDLLTGLERFVTPLSDILTQLQEFRRAVQGAGQP